MRFRFPPIALAFAFFALFLAANRAAYQGYFSDDDLDNLVNTQLYGLDAFVGSFFSLTYDQYNFRPVGHLVYRWMAQTVGLTFWPYVALMQTLLLGTVLLLYRTTSSLIGPRGAAITAFIFAFHPALIAAHWKPMYLFDVLCGFALVLAYSSYRRGRWILALALFWCGYKAKEIAILFPVVLMIEELLNQRKWMRVIPFFLLSGTLGIQALTANHARPPSPYTLTFTAAAIATCARYYLLQSWGIPWISLAGWRWAQDSRRWMILGVTAAALLLGPLLFLPGRLFAVYLFVPLLFGSIAMGAVLARCGTVVLTVGALFFMAIGLRELRAFRRVELAQATRTRSFVTATCKAFTGQPRIDRAVYEGGPGGLNVWGVEGAIRLCSGNLSLKLRRFDLHRLEVGESVVRWSSGGPKGEFVEIHPFAGELAGDWHEWEGAYRWMGQHGTITIETRAQDTTLVVDLAAAQADEAEARVDGRSLGKLRLASHGEQTLKWAIPSMQGPKALELIAWPAVRPAGDPRSLTLAVRDVRTTP